MQRRTFCVGTLRSAVGAEISRDIIMVQVVQYSSSSLERLDCNSSGVVVLTPSFCCCRPAVRPMATSVAVVDVRLLAEMRTIIGLPEPWFRPSSNILAPLADLSLLTRRSPMHRSLCLFHAFERESRYTRKRSFWTICLIIFDGDWAPFDEKTEQKTKQNLASKYMGPNFLMRNVLSTAHPFLWRNHDYKFVVPIYFYSTRTHRHRHTLQKSSCRKTLLW